jgi:hypothetical protein
VDFSFVADGVHNSNFIIAEMEQKGMELSRGITLLVKMLLAAHNLNDASRGGLGSFPLCVMVLWYVRVEVSRFPALCHRSITAAFLGFLHYYSSTFDYRRQSIHYAKRSLLEKPLSGELSVVNPLNWSKNCASSCSTFGTEIRPMFSRVYARLVDLASNGDEQPVENAFLAEFSTAVSNAGGLTFLHDEIKHLRTEVLSGVDSSISCGEARWDRHGAYVAGCGV